MKVKSGKLPVDGVRQQTVNCNGFADKVHFWTSHFWPYLILSWPSS